MDSRDLLAWARAEWASNPDGRAALPWRHTRDPWEVLVSEVMLQQTQVARVLPRWTAFLERFPTTAACAAAPLGDVLREWSGLGYPRRARDLHRTAVIVEVDRGGRFPDALADLMTLPGVGPYTARAVLAFANECDVAVVDTNVGRVLARSVGRRLRPSEAQSVADSLVPPGRGWEWNQAMLDLGAMVCTPREPACDRCPVVGSCTWFDSGRPVPDPARGSAAVSRAQSRYAGSARQARGLLLRAAEAGPVEPEGAAVLIGWTDRSGDVRAVIDSLVADDLLTLGTDGRLVLPGSSELGRNGVTD